jgi:ERF superfamily
MTLLEKLHSIYTDIDFIEKAGKNKAQNYQYMRAADVVRTLRAKFTEHKIYAEINYDFVGGPFTIAREKAPTAPFAAVNVRCSIVFHDLESFNVITASGVGTGCDNNDKASYKAMTGALKYALKNAFLIPDEADPEADERVDDVGAQSSVTMDELPPYDDYSDVPSRPAASHGKPPERKQAARPTPASEPYPEAPVEDGVTAVDGSPATVPSADVVEDQSTEQAASDAPALEGPLPTNEEMDVFRKNFEKLGNELADKGKLKASKGLPAPQKLKVFLLHITKAPKAAVINKAQWDDFFARVAVIAAKEDGMVQLAKLVNKVNGVEDTKKK